MAIDFSELPVLGRRIWDAVVPPLVHLGAAVGVIIFVGVAPRRSLMSGVTLLPDAHTRDILDFYGVPSVMPLVAALTLLVLAHGVEHLLTWLGARLPPHFGANSTLQLRAAVDEWMLRQLWVLHPDLEHVELLNILNRIVDETVAQAEVEAKANHRLRALAALRHRPAVHRGQLRFGKGLIVVAAGACIGGAIYSSDFQSHLMRFLIILVPIALWIYTQAGRESQIEPWSTSSDDR